MKVIALMIVLITLVVGTYLTNLAKENKAADRVMIQDSVGSSMAAPKHVPETPL